MPFRTMHTTRASVWTLVGWLNRLREPVQYAVPVLITEQRHAALPVRFPFRISRRMIGCNHSYYEPPISLNLRLRDTLPYRLLKAVFRYIHADIL